MIRHSGSASRLLFAINTFFVQNLKSVCLSSHGCYAGQVGDTSRSYFQGQRSDPKLALESQNNSDPRSQSHIEDMDLGYEDKPSLQSFEDLEQKFLDDIRQLAKEQNDAEDAENARHREVCLYLKVDYVLLYLDSQFVNIIFLRSPDNLKQSSL